MIYPHNFEQKIGFDAIRRMLAGECISTMGVELSEEISFISDFDKLDLYLRHGLEMKRVLMLENPFPSQDYLDLRPELKRLKIKGSFITLEGLQALSLSYSVLCELRKYLLALDPEIYPALYSMTLDLEVIEELPHQIGFILDPLTNQMRDNASEELYRIRSLIRKRQSESYKQIQKYLGLARKEGWTGDNAEATVRGDRLVIPVQSAYKRQIRGFIHDISSSGQTVFLEPEEVFNLNNELTELRNEERIEIIRILKDFSLYLYPLLPTLIKGYSFLGNIDFIRAKAKLAIKMNAGMPIINREPCFIWRQARHPLLKDPVPLTFCLDKGEKIVIISGPNAGGKSVCLKTIGLLQYMLQCGLLVPMSESSETGLFKHIFVDIGDEQSIEDDLSTYSSHLKNMRFWIENVDNQTLFLADELGSGTEPQAGGAIAEALLEQMEKDAAWGVVTTHYTQLKLLSKNHASMVNGAMLFNKEEMKPLYIFKKGLPGSSFAFEMAQKIGFPYHVLKSAKSKTGKQHLKFEEELQQIEVEKHSLLKQKKEIELADEILSSTLKKYKDLTAELEGKKSDYLKAAKTQAAEIIAQSNKRIEQTIREIKEAQAEKAATQSIRKQLQSDIKSVIDLNNVDQPNAWQANVGQAYAGLSNTGLSYMGQPKAINIKAYSNTTSSSKEIKVGSLVKRIGSKEAGTVIEVKKNKAKVDFDFLRIDIPITQLQLLGSSEIKQEEEKRNRVRVKIEKLQEGKTGFYPYLDIRGERLEDALEKVSKLVDEAILYGEYHLEILHGKGHGILKENIRKLLKHNSNIAMLSDQKEELGGAGITIVELKK